MKLMCKKDFRSFKSGEYYEYYTNFGGLNHIVVSGDDKYPFDGDIDTTRPGISKRPYLYDYFYKIDESRDIIINKILNK